MKVVLMGYMASGKSLIGKELGHALKVDFIDLDDFIENSENTSIKNIFSNKGEIYFRKKEHFYLKQLLQSDKSFVLSLGGGTPCFINNLELIKEKEDVFSVYLKLPIPVLVSRLLKEKEHRPLISHLNTEEQLTEFVGKHLFERVPYYSQADIQVDGNKVSSVIVDEIVSKLP